MQLEPDEDPSLEIENVVIDMPKVSEMKEPPCMLNLLEGKYDAEYFEEQLTAYFNALHDDEPPERDYE